MLQKARKKILYPFVSIAFFVAAAPASYFYWRQPTPLLLNIGYLMFLKLGYYCNPSFLAGW
ncbi:MAG TPA: hypothetical protein DCW46_10955 [Desulfotomaculum sp.]|nr:hypothetical protein [Desulfotomaculum sp.]